MLDKTVCCCEPVSQERQVAEHARVLSERAAEAAKVGAHAQAVETAC